MPFIMAYKNDGELNENDYDVFDSTYPIPNDTTTAVKFDLVKLSKFFDFKFLLKSDEKFYHQTFKTCTINDFIKNGINEYR